MGSSDASTPGSPNPGKVPAKPKAPKKKPGQLRIFIEREGGVIKGSVGVADDSGRSNASRNVEGKSRIEAVFPEIPPGLKHVVFVSSDVAPAAVRVELSEAGEAEATIRLAEATELRGVVVDALQRPLPRAKVTAIMTGVFTPSKPPKKPRPVVMGGEARLVGVGLEEIPMSRSFGATTDGVVRQSCTTDHEGRFHIQGLSGSSVTVEVKYEKTVFTQACSTDQEAFLIAPVRPAPAPPDFKTADFRRATDRLLRLMVENPESDEVYWQQLKALLLESVEGSKVSKADKEMLLQSIQKTEELRNRRPEEK